MSAELNKVLSQIQVEAQHLHVDSIAQQAASYLSTLDQAKSGEMRVNEAMQKVMDARLYLQGTREQIESQLPKGELTGQSAIALDDVRRAASDIDRVLNERAAKVDDIVNMAKEDTKVRDELIREGQGCDERGLFVRGFSPIAEKLRELKLSMDCQDGYVNALQAKVDAFNVVRMNDPLVSQRQTVFESITQALKSFEEASSFIKEGMTFYDKLKQLVDQLRSSFESEKIKAQTFQQPVPPQYQQQSFTPQPSYPAPYPNQGQPPYGSYQPAQYQPSTTPTTSVSTSTSATSVPSSTTTITVSSSTTPISATLPATLSTTLSTTI